MWQVHGYEMWSFTIVSMSLRLLISVSNTNVMGKGISHFPFAFINIADALSQKLHSRSLAVSPMNWLPWLHIWASQAKVVQSVTCGHLRMLLRHPLVTFTMVTIVTTIILWYSVNRVSTVMENIEKLGNFEKWDFGTCNRRYFEECR